jgi:hypothetical protein
MKRAAALLVAFLLSACSGGGSAVPGTKIAAGTGARTGAALAIRIPHAPSAAGAVRRSPAYISAGTQSVVVTVYGNGDSSPLGGYPVTFNLTPTSPGCVAGQSSTVCTIALSLAPNIYSISLTTYAGLNGTGNQLSAAQYVPATIMSGQANTIAVTLGGIPLSVQLLPAYLTVVAQEHVVTLPSSMTGTILAYALDGAGEEIIGPGAPAISASTDNGAQIAVTQPTAGQPNTIGLSSLAAHAIAHVTVTATPAAGTGNSIQAVSRWVTVQDPSMSLLYVASAYSVHVLDATATEVTPSGSPFSTIAQGAGATGLAYDPQNGLIYIAVQATPSYVVAFDKSGNPQPLNAGASGLGTAGGIAYDPTSGWLYLADNNVALDASGNQHALNSGLQFYYGVTYDSVDNLIFAGPYKFNAAGTPEGSLAFPSSGQIQNETFDPVNDEFYVGTAYPTAVEVHSSTGALLTPSGTFPIAAGTFIGGIAADPVTGDVYVATNSSVTYGFDLNGHLLPAPWHTVSGIGSPSGAAGMALIQP